MRHITVIHPSRGRAELCKNAFENVLRGAYSDPTFSHLHYVVAIEPDQAEEYAKVFYENKTWIDCRETKSAIEAINSAARSTPHVPDIIVVMSDDFVLPKGWDTMIREAVGDKTDFVLKTFDTTQKWICTLPIMDKVYYDRFGYVYNPGYKHMFCLPGETKIYMEDYGFKNISEILPGDIVIGTERRLGKFGKTQLKDFLCKSKVTEVHSREADIYELTMSSGNKIKCTEDHIWGYYDGGRELRYGPAKIGRRLKKVFNMPENPPCGLEYEIGWLAGMWDGEGSFNTISQSETKNPGVCERIERILNKLNFKYSINYQKQQGKYSERTQKVYTINGGRSEYIRLMNWLKPVKRNTPRSDKLMLSARYGEPDTVMDIKKIGFGKVYCLTTDTRNFIADGYLSHNCDTELTHVAELLGKLIVRNDIVFPHRTEVTGNDAINKKNNSTWAQGEALYLQRVKENFGLPEELRKPVSYKPHQKWINQKI